MIERVSLPNRHALSRRRLITVGAGAAVGVLAGLSPRRAARRAQARRHPGHYPAGADCDPGFRRGRAAGSRRRAQCQSDHHLEPAALRPVRADRPGRLYRENLNHRHLAAVCRLAADQRPGAGHRSRDAGRRPAQGRVPAVGRVRRSAAARRAVQHHGRQLAAHLAHHFGRDLRADHRRERATSTAASCSSTNPARRSGASSGSR